MIRKGWFIGISVVAIVLFVLGSLSNVVGYQTVQSSIQRVENTDADSRERIFHTIRVLANNQEIQNALFEFNMIQPGNLIKDFPSIHHPTITNHDLDVAYKVGSFLIKIMGETRVMFVLNRLLMRNGGENVLSEVIQHNASLQAEVSALADLKSPCDCGETSRLFPPIVLCVVLIIFAILNDVLYGLSYFLYLLFTDLYHTSYFYVFLVCVLLSRIFNRFASVFLEISGTAFYLLVYFECIDPYPWSSKDW